MQCIYLQWPAEDVQAAIHQLAYEAVPVNTLFQKDMLLALLH